MGRHADPTAPARRPAPVVLIAAGVVAVLLAGGLVWWLAGSGEDCDTRQTVAVTVAPELGDVTEELLAEPIVLDDGVCAVAEVTAQEPLQTVGDLGALDADALPAVWVPDSSLWAARAGDAPLEGAGSMGTSPVVLATSRAVADALGWTDAAPELGQALATGRPLAVPDLAASAEGLAALAAVRSSLGGGEDADNAVVQAVLAAAAGDADRAGRCAGRRCSRWGGRPAGAGQRAGGVPRPTRTPTTRRSSRSTRPRAPRTWTTRCCAWASASGDARAAPTPSSAH